MMGIVEQLILSRFRLIYRCFYCHHTHLMLHRCRDAPVFLQFLASFRDHATLNFGNSTVAFQVSHSTVPKVVISISTPQDVLSDM